MSFSRSPVAYSAPSKVLLAGGYLVLDREHTGTVFSLDARIHVHVEPAGGQPWTPPDTRFSPEQQPVGNETEKKASLGEARPFEVLVESPQFPGAEWKYTCTLASVDAGVNVVPDLRGGRHEPNCFLQTTLEYVLTYVCGSLASTYSSSIRPADAFPSCHVKILAEDDFYSTGRSDCCAAKDDADVAVKRFRAFPSPLEQTSKTGLGSSAALVTALTASLLAFYAPADAESANGESRSWDTDTGTRLHNLAQAAHSAAQGKIGSGFDIAAAVYGSCVYRRFSPAILSTLGDESTTSDFARRLRACVDGEAGGWDTEIGRRGIALPLGLRLVLCDVETGTSTRGMVREMARWRARQPAHARQLFAELQKSNDGFLDAITGSGGVMADVATIESVMRASRSLVQQLSRASGVPIEPQELSALLDVCVGLEGVVGACPVGAGGFDAAALVVQDDSEVLHRVRAALEQWRPPVAASCIKSARLLGVRGGREGLKKEAPRAGSVDSLCVSSAMVAK